MRMPTSGRVRHAVPWFYPLVLVALLVHRERRDDAACRAKYGDDWTAYCRKVPWRIVPGGTSVRRGAYLRDFVFDFIGSFAPPLTKALVQRALNAPPGSDHGL